MLVDKVQGYMDVNKNILEKSYKCLSIAYIISLKLSVPPLLKNTFSLYNNKKNYIKNAHVYFYQIIQFFCNPEENELQNFHRLAKIRLLVKPTK